MVRNDVQKMCIATISRETIWEHLLHFPILEMSC